MIDRPSCHSTSTLHAMANRGPSVVCNSPGTVSRHHHAASTSAAVDFGAPDDWKDETAKARRHSSDCPPWLSRHEMSSGSRGSLLAQDSAGDFPSVPVISADSKLKSGQNSAQNEDVLMSFACLLNELELLARTVNFLPFPTPPSTSLSALCDAFTLPMATSFSTTNMVSILVIHALVASWPALEPLQRDTQCI